MSGVLLPVRIGENDSEIVDRNGSLLCVVYGTAVTNRSECSKQIVAALNGAQSEECRAQADGLPETRK